MTQSFRPADTGSALRSIPLDDAALDQVAGGGKGAALLFRDIGRLIGGLFKTGAKELARTDQKISTIHDAVADRAARLNG